jgi:hypothetical protein
MGISVNPGRHADFGSDERLRKAPNLPQERREKDLS